MILDWLIGIYEALEKHGAFDKLGDSAINTALGMGLLAAVAKLYLRFSRARDEKLGEISGRIINIEKAQAVQDQRIEDIEDDIERIEGNGPKLIM